jgi:hypothetical protein
MKLYSIEDVHNYHYLMNKYMELADESEKLYQDNEDKNAIANSIELKYLLTQIKTAKDMMNDLGTEVPDDKAKALGFEIL